MSGPYDWASAGVANTNTRAAVAKRAFFIFSLLFLLRRPPPAYDW
jgi:hypothetical protein